MSQAPVPGPFRPGPPASGPPRPVPGPAPAVGGSGTYSRDPGQQSRDPGRYSGGFGRGGPEGDGSGHPAVDAVLQAMANAADLPPADQIAQYEAAHQTLRETLATIDQA
ncbi:hypothetical protein [Plantactinospora endophytica]|nr:hypothetical protein [Plantactinospora endophytica]